MPVQPGQTNDTKGTANTMQNELAQWNIKGTKGTDKEPINEISSISV